MSNSALSGCGTFLCPVCDHGLYEKPMGWRLVGWIFSRFADQNQPLMFFGSKSLRPSQPVKQRKNEMCKFEFVMSFLIFSWSFESCAKASHHWNRRDDPMSRCRAHPSLGSAWRWDCSPLVSQSRRHPCSIHGRDYEPRASRHAWWRVRELRHCRNSCDLYSWIVWHLGERERRRWRSAWILSHSSCNLVGLRLCNLSSFLG